MNQEDFYRNKLANKDWRMSHLYTIVNKDKQKVTFKKNRAQQHFEENRAERNVILKSRQLGFTTDESQDTLDDTLYTPNFESLFIAHTQDEATNIFNKKISFSWNSYDKDLAKLWKIKADSANKLTFDFGDGTLSSITVANSGRSGTYNRVHISEFAKLCVNYPKRANEIITGTIPSVPLDGRIDIESTAEGMGGHFYNIFWEAWDRGEPQHPTQFKAHFYNWTWDDAEIAKVTQVIPIHQMEEGHKFADYQKLYKLTDVQITYYYLKWLSLVKDWNKLHQEYPTTPQEAFVASGTPYFDNEKIMEYIQKAPQPIEIGDIRLEDSYGLTYQEYRHKIKKGEQFEYDWLESQKQIKFTESERGDIKIWRKPEPYAAYTIGGDVAEGKENGDYSTIEVIDNKTLKCVAKYRGHCRPDELTHIAYALGMWYNYAYMGIESNTGLWVNTELYETLEYPNMYFREAMDDITHRVGRQLGFLTSEKTRKPILDELRKMLALYPDIWTNADFLNEALVFVRNERGRPEAMSGRHDDEVIATAIAYEIRYNAPEEYDEPHEIPQTGTEYVKARLSKLYGDKNRDVISQSDFI